MKRNKMFLRVFMLLMANNLAYGLAISPGKVASLNSVEGHNWYARLGDYSPDLANTDFNAAGYQKVTVPANLAPQLKASGLETFHYRVRFELMEKPRAPYAIRLGEINDRDITLLNGQEIGHTGDFAADKPQAYDKVRIYSIPAEVLRVGQNELVIIAKGVLEKESGLYRDRVEIGPAEEIYRAFYLENLWDLLAIVSYLTFGLYFLLFFIRRRHDRENLYFAIFAIALVVYSTLHTQLKYVYGLELYFWKKVQYLALFALVPTFYHFIRNYYRLSDARWVKVWDFICYATNAVIAAIALTVSVTSDVKLWDNLQNNLVTYLWFVYIAGIAVILFREAFRKNRDAIIMLMSFFILLVAMVLDILSGRAIINLPPLLTYVFIFFVVSMALILANRFVRLHDETEALNESLSRFNAASRRFVPFEFLKMLEKQSILDVHLGDQVQREMTILFSDIRGFTNLSEKMTPKENFDFINTYLDKVGPVIREHKGFIDKYIGDAVMALFPHSAQDALEAALAMHKKVADWNSERAQHGQETVAIGIGIHWGKVMLGTIGEHERMDGTVISDAVNLASRIESLTKLYGARILISDTAWQRIDQRENYAHRIVDRVSVKGKTEPATLIEVFAADETGIVKSKLRQLQAFAEAILLYQRGLFHEAKIAFLSLAASEPADKVPTLYLQRIDKYLRNPPEQWAGYEILHEK